MAGTVRDYGRTGTAGTSLCRVQPRDELGRGEWLRNKLERLPAEVAHRQLVVEVAGTDDDASVRACHEVVVDQLTRAATWHDAVGHQDGEFRAALSDHDAPGFDIAHFDDMVAGVPEGLRNGDSDVAVVFRQQHRLPDGRGRHARRLCGSRASSAPVSGGKKNFTDVPFPGSLWRSITP